MGAAAFLVQNTSVSVEDPVVPRPDFVPDWVRAWMVDLAGALFVVVLAWLVSRLAVRVFSRPIAQYFSRQSLSRVALGGIRGVIYLFALLTVLRIYGLDLSSIALSVTVFTAVLGVVLAPIVGSFISGVFLLADQPYEIGDMIELPDRDTRGYVDDITLRYTKIFTLDNTFLVIPNGEMRSRDVVNYSAEDSRVRRTLEVLVTYESDIGKARQRMAESARAVEGVVTGGPTIRVGAARYPAGPECLVGSFADSGVLLRLRYWVSEPYRLETVQSKVQTRVWDAFEGDAIEIAYPHSQVVFGENSGELQVSAGESGADLSGSEGRPHGPTDGDSTGPPADPERTDGGDTT
ncbi:MAG: small-conductance mechanosensitive channel [Salinirussus sp.]|jgi:small-conductance mechanosensitive channel